MEKQESLDNAGKYKAWREALTQNGITVNKVEELHVQRRHKDGGVLYALLNIDAEAPEGTKLNPICFLKGDAVSVMVVLIDDETDDRYILLVRQRRICDGSELHEHPAGMIDDDDDQPIDVAARELNEETQLDVKADELKPLFDRPLFSATATSDEALHFFYLERRMPLAEIQALNGRKTGAEGENEHTRLYVATLPEAHRLVHNIHGIMAHLLYLQQVGDYETMKVL